MTTNPPSPQAQGVPGPVSLPPSPTQSTARPVSVSRHTSSSGGVTPLTPRNPDIPLLEKGPSSSTGISASSLAVGLVLTVETSLLDEGGTLELRLSAALKKVDE